MAICFRVEELEKFGKNRDIIPEMRRMYIKHASKGNLYFTFTQDVFTIINYIYSFSQRVFTRLDNIV